MTTTKAVPGGLTIRPLTHGTWDAFADLAERHNGVWNGCWCTWFHPPCAERGQSGEGNRALKEQAGFTFSRPKGKNHCVMSTTVAPAG